MALLLSFLAASTLSSLDLLLPEIHEAPIWQSMLDCN